MEVKKYIEILHTFEALKCNTRHSWTSSGRHESVAEHCFRLSLMAYFVKDEFPGIDIEKVILMCLCHDFGEAFTGDIPSFKKTEADEKKELEAIENFLKSLPEPYRAELSGLFEEMERLETTEAKLYKALDNTEAILQHNEADLCTWLPLEYKENLVYGNNAVAFSDYMKSFREELLVETKKKTGQCD